MPDSEIETWFTAEQCRCFFGNGYSEEQCSQRFDTVDEAKQHALQYHAAPDHEAYFKHTLQEVE